jgi:hypothetical protein
MLLLAKAICNLTGKSAEGFDASEQTGGSRIPSRIKVLNEGTGFVIRRIILGYRRQRRRVEYM